MRALSDRVVVEPIVVDEGMSDSGKLHLLQSTLAKDAPSKGVVRLVGPGTGWWK